jgi:integrase
MVNFVLKNPGGKDKTLIYLCYYFDARRFKYSTGQKIHPDNWNKVKQRPRRDYEGYKELNFLLDRIEGMVSDAHRRIINDGEQPSPAKLRIELDRCLGKRQLRRRESLSQFIDRFISESTHRATSKTIFKTVQKHFSGFPGPKDFDDINVKWFEKYMEYLEAKDFSLNYIGKNISVIKQFIHAAQAQGVCRLSPVMRMRKLQEDACNIYLSTEELLLMYRCDLSGPQRRVCDRFMIGAFTALRFSDFSLIRAQNINQDIIRISQRKTGDAVVIPMHWIVKEIFERYGGQLPRPISNQKMNDALKLIAKKAGIKGDVVKYRTKGGERTNEAFEKWELVSTHTARRSAATNMYLAGLPTFAIMKITGHRTEKSFFKYIRISLEENAIRLLDHPFFQPVATLPAKEQAPDNTPSPATPQ